VANLIIEIATGFTPNIANRKEANPIFQPFSRYNSA
jgi:hypothetical protein